MKRMPMMLAGFLLSGSMLSHASDRFEKSDIVNCERAFRSELIRA